jgi:Flp pilus assembly protein TadD
MVLESAKGLQLKHGREATSPVRTMTPGEVRKVSAICVLLLLLVWIVFGQTHQFSFVSYDDEKHISENRHVTAGLTTDGICWAFTPRNDDYWHPIDYLSHMTDCQLFGLNAGGHHLMNVALHGVAVVLLFVVFGAMTHAIWRSAFVAAIFAIHPLHVESVAWITERKDVLSGLFTMLTIGAYLRYTRHPFSLGRYLAVLILFSAGLMAKPTIMALPIALLALDYWPLGRLQHENVEPLSVGQSLRAWRDIFLEKVPLFALSAAAFFLAALGNAPAFESSKNLSRILQIENAIVSYSTYIWQSVYPFHLAVLYPFPEKRISGGHFVWSLFLLGATSLVAFLLRSRHKYLFVGWLWYLVMALPTIGLVQAGGFAHADRYTYLPQIGLALLVTWGVTDLTARLRYQERILGASALLMIAFLSWVAWRQVQTWRDSDTLWQHTLAVTSGNYFADEAYGTVLFKRGQLDEAISHYQAAEQVQPTYSVYQGLGSAFAKRGDLGQATEYLRAALQMRPTDPEAHSNLAAALFRNGRMSEAIIHWEKALEVRPNDAGTERNLAAAFQKLGDADRAILHWERSLQIEPNAEAYNALGIAISQTVRIDEAMAQWQKALALDAENMPALCNLAWVLATSPDDRVRDGAKAVTLAGRAVRNSGSHDPRVLRVLAAACAEEGQFSEAVSAAERAAQLALDQGNTALADVLRDNAALFRANKPLRDSPTSAQ